MSNRNYKKNGRESHSNNCPFNFKLTPSDVAKLQCSLLKQLPLSKQQELYEQFGQIFPSPPATASSSLSTSCNCNSAPQYAIQCNSSVISDEESNNNYQTNSAENFYFRPQNSCYNEIRTDYTANEVQDIVHMKRDPNKPRIVSNKVFVGGISHSVNRQLVNDFFAKYGEVFIDWPMKNKGHHSRYKKSAMSSYSYLFLVYTSEDFIINLLRDCDQSYHGFFVSLPFYYEPMQIRPWFIENTFYMADGVRDAKVIDIHRTVFVGGLPRIVTANQIAEIFSQFGKVLVVTIDIDMDYGYPKDVARITFEKDSAFRLALKTKILRLANIDSSKTIIEIKPYVVEDVGCDQCGGLWFNPFVDIYKHLAAAKEASEKKKKITPDFNMWTSNHPMLEFTNKSSEAPAPAPEEDLPSKMEKIQLSSEENEVEAGARKFLEMTKSMGLDKPQIFNVDGVDYAVGPDLWDKFLPPPLYNLETEPIEQEQRVQSFLRMREDDVCSNKSVYCKDGSCLQYYCPSCSNKIHSGAGRHSVPPIVKSERRPHSPF
uniref:RRM domain-containing protein n=1 Tax=Caenorhabditis tropicalis TaxID=1561998 RepID=A0A1I7T2P0_9PELO